MTKLVIEAYYPTVPPTEFRDWPRWMTEELQRIDLALNKDPILVALIGTGTIGIDSVPTSLILGIGDTPKFEYPDGTWNTVTGEWEVSGAGIYLLNANAVVDAFGSGNKNYTATLTCEVNGVERLKTQDSSQDDFPLGMALASPLLLETGDLCTVVLTTEHEQFSGSTTYNYQASYLRITVPWR